VPYDNYTNKCIRTFCMLTYFTPHPTHFHPEDGSSIFLYTTLCTTERTTIGKLCLKHFYMVYIQLNEGGMALDAVHCVILQGQQVCKFYENIFGIYVSGSLYILSYVTQ